MVSYGKIALKLLRRSQENPDLPSSPSFFQNARKSFFILLVFTICFLPYHMVRPFYIATQIQPTSLFWRNVANTTNELTLVLSALNSCLDPVMYYLLSSSVRKEVLNLVSRVFCLPHAPEVSATSYTADMDGRKTTDTPNQLSSAKLQENKSWTADFFGDIERHLISRGKDNCNWDVEQKEHCGKITVRNVFTTYTSCFSLSTLFVYVFKSHLR